jgi:predicted PhzF superfamily epimerase YddE/YHI9
VSDLTRDPVGDPAGGVPARGEIEVDVVRVFVDDEGGHGNPLGIVDGELVPIALRQEVAAALGYSETVFVDDPDEGRIQIFTPMVELAFAGHPTVGTAWWLHAKGYAADRLVVPAGTIEVSRDGDLTRVLGRPEWVPNFTWHHLDSVAEVEAIEASTYAEGEHYVWAWLDEEAGQLRARMFSPAFGIAEDQATGSAAIALTGQQGRDLDIVQGTGSRIRTTWEAEGWATVGGLVVAEPSRTI